ncbi:MAG: hypothetical protein ABJC13_16625 [Acidobacteriota bacterium]
MRRDFVVVQSVSAQVRRDFASVHFLSALVRGRFALVHFSSAEVPGRFAQVQCTDDSRLADRAPLSASGGMGSGRCGPYSGTEGFRPGTDVSVPESFLLFHGDGVYFAN